MSYYLGEGEQIFNNIYYVLKEGKVFTKIHPNFSLLLKMVKGFNYSDYDLTLGTKGAEKGKRWFCTLQYVKMKNNKILSRHDLLYKEFNMTNDQPLIIKEAKNEIATKIKIKNLNR